MSLHLTSYIVLIAVLWGMVALLNVQEWQWCFAVREGIKGVLYANSDSWAMARIGKPVQVSWCLSVREIRTFVYHYDNRSVVV